MRVSIILTTYNSPRWLEKTVWGYYAQSHQDFELVVADDGSVQETALLIQRLRKKTGLTIKHVWHEDRGFRKCTILNQAILVTECDYLIFSDADCIPRWDFVATHARLAEPGNMLSGGCVRLPLDLSKRITIQDILDHRCTDPRWLTQHGLPRSKQLLKLLEGRLLTQLLEIFTPTSPTSNGHNMSFWKADVLRVNGFDERMEYGGLDRELGERLLNLGIRSKQIRHRAACVHLDHGHGYVREEAVQCNRRIRHATRSGKVTWTEFGIDRHPTDESKVA